MSFVTKVDPYFEKFGIFDYLKVFEEDIEHTYPEEFPCHIEDSWEETTTCWFDKQGNDEDKKGWKLQEGTWDDYVEAKRRWEQYPKLVTMLREIRTYFTPPSEITQTSYIKDLLNRIDDIE
jgi:hypothetical protein